MGQFDSGQHPGRALSSERPAGSAIDRVRNIFATFSDWTNAGALDQVYAAAQAQPGSVTEHYVTILHLLHSATEVH